MGKQVRFLDGASHMLIDAAVVPKNRKPKFELALKVLDLNNVPLVSGSSYVKWHIAHSSAAEHRGKTPRVTIKDHKVTWNYEKTVTLRLTIDKSGMLQDTHLTFDVVQEYASGRAGADRITLGVVHVNLAEYVDVHYESDEGVVRRYLMQESKINSTLKLAISMTQIEGEKNFKAPSLKTAPIFGGIAGIINVEQAEQEDSALPTAPRKLTRDVGEMHDLYRHTLTAAYTSHDTELPADECIEDIFAGGDGWGPKNHHVKFQFHRGGESDDESVSPPKIRPPESDHPGGHRRKGSKTNVGKKAHGEQANSSSSDDHKKMERLRDRDVPEIELREDLRSWHISEV